MSRMETEFTGKLIDTAQAQEFGLDRIGPSISAALIHTGPVEIRQPTPQMQATIQNVSLRGMIDDVDWATRDLRRKMGDATEEAMRRVKGKMGRPFIKGGEFVQPKNRAELKEALAAAYTKRGEKKEIDPSVLDKADLSKLHILRDAKGDIYSVFQLDDKGMLTSFGGLYVRDTAAHFPALCNAVGGLIDSGTDVKQVRGIIYSDEAHAMLDAGKVLTREGKFVEYTTDINAKDILVGTVAIKEDKFPATMEGFREKVAELAQNPRIKLDLSPLAEDGLLPSDVLPEKVLPTVVYNGSRHFHGGGIKELGGLELGDRVLSADIHDMETVGGFSGIALEHCIAPLLRKAGSIHLPAAGGAFFPELTEVRGTISVPEATEGSWPKLDKNFKEMIVSGGRNFFHDRMNDPVTILGKFSPWYNKPSRDACVPLTSAKPGEPQPA